MLFKAQAKADGKDILIVGVTSVQSIRGMLVVKWGQEIATYNYNDLTYLEVTHAD